MKNRWIGGLALATALMLGACAPPNQGGGEPTEGDAATSSLPTTTAEPIASAEPAETEGAEASETAAPTPDDYEY